MVITSDATDSDRNKYTSFGIHELILLSARNLEISIVFFFPYLTTDPIRQVLYKKA